MLKLFGIGHLGSDARVNNVGGKEVINFSFAHTDSWKDSKGEKQEKTTWVDCSYWPQSTKIAEFLKKGTQVYVEGNAEVRTYQKADAGFAASLSCRVHSIQLLGGKREGQAETKQPAAADAPENGGGYKPVETSASAASEEPLPF